MSLSEVVGSGQAPLPLPSPDDVASRASDLARDLQALAASGLAVDLPDGTIQDLMAALVATYGARFDAGLRQPPIEENPTMGATAVLVTASALLKAANLEIFELGMWQSWSGTR
ncbi:hypothetical protein [Enterovirga sp. CN4-39]|uniref:hypothetical protein n=1 Tax=Enterovirga sp. CN4-39 TaxID=3400910 RepID=UPI003C11E99A